MSTFGVAVVVSLQFMVMGYLIYKIIEYRKENKDE